MKISQTSLESVLLEERDLLNNNNAVGATASDITTIVENAGNYVMNVVAN